MSFNELWIIIERKNPRMKQGTITMSTPNFKKVMRLAYNKGAESIPTRNKAAGDLFGKMFR